ncbi:hypothetical protein KPL70_002998 [Citrus sinensis]|nr:hypothetical protein KPL70_002998 [Citrus sinensis]
MSYGKVSPPPLASDRFTKKTKFRVEGADGDNPTPLSYRDIAMEANAGSAKVVFGMSDEWELEEEDVCCKEDESMPYIAFSQRVHDRLAKPWANSVVVKTLGRNLGYRVISERLKKLWGSTMGFSIIDLANDYYLIDYLTAAAQRGKFARIAVQLDLEKPLVSQFNFEGRVQKVEYENLPLICFCCGKFGHYQEACPDGGVTPVEVELPTSCPDAANRDMVVGEGSNQNESKFGS